MLAGKWKSRESISVRMILAIVGFSTFIALFATAGQLFLDYRRNVDRVHDDLAYVEVVSLQPLSTNLWNLAEENVQQQLDSLVNHPGIDYAAIRVKDEIAWDSGTEPKGDVITAEYPLLYERRNVKQELGHLRIVAGLSAIYQQLVEKALVILGTNFLKTLAVAAFMYVLFHLFFTRHLVGLADYARNMNLKDLAKPLRFRRTRLEGKRRDEFDDIALAMNQMQTNLKKSYDELEERTKKQQKSEALFRAVVNHSPTKIHIKDVEGRYTLINKEAGKLFGVTDEEGRGKTSYDLFRKEVADAFTVHDQRVIESGEALEEEEEFTLDDGVHTYLTTKFPIFDQDGITGIGAIGTDITERKQAEEDRRLALIDAEQANQAKSEFLASMSHELRTPLNAILGFADILSGQYFGPISEKYREYAGDIHASGEHLMELVNDILDLSTIEAGKQSLLKEKLSTEEVVRECERIVEGKARSKGIDLVMKVPKDLPPLYADKRAAKQILLNLLSNAVKFTPQGGKITVSVKASKKNTTLKVADTGQGIPAEKLPKLTDPFTRVDTDPYLAEQGWGLGLTITKSLVELHDGKLDIKSKVGKGTTVTVTLPNGAP